MAQPTRLVYSNRSDNQGSVADLIVRSAHIKYPNTMIQSQTINYESLILPGHLISEETKLVFKRVEQVAYRDSRSRVEG